MLNVNAFSLELKICAKQSEDLGYRASILYEIKNGGKAMKWKHVIGLLERVDDEP